MHAVGRVRSKTLEETEKRTIVYTNNEARLELEMHTAARRLLRRTCGITSATNLRDSSASVAAVLRLSDLCRSRNQ